LDFLHFDVFGLRLSSTPNPEVGVLEAIYDMKRVIISQQSKIDMLRAKARASRSEVAQPKSVAHFHWIIITLLLLVSLRIISMLPSQDIITFQAKEINSQEETIVSQAEIISLLQEELRQTREFYWLMTKVVVGVVSIGFYALSGLKNKIRYQNKLIVDQIYNGLISGCGQGCRQGKNQEKQSFSLLLLSLITFSVFVGELYIVSTLI